MKETKNKFSLSPSLFALPFLLSFLLFWLWPIAASLFLAFFRYNPLKPNEFHFIGINHFLALFQDIPFQKALVNTLLFVVGTIPGTTLVALFLALLISRVKWLKSFFQSALFLPSMISMVVIATLFKILYSSQGPLTKLLIFFGYTRVEGILNFPDTALLGIMIMNIWSASGYYALLFIAGLEQIDQTLYEAAQMDGASSWEQFRFITLPLLKPVLLFIMVINTIRSFQIFNEIFILTGGGPLHATTTLVFDLYQTGFQNLEMGFASAKGYVLLLLISLATLIQFKFSEERSLK